MRPEGQTPKKNQDEIVAIASKGGVIGIRTNGESNPTMGDMVCNIDYVKKVAGIDHVGIGSDQRGMASYTREFDEDANFGAIVEALRAHGYSDSEAGAVMGGNYFRVWQQFSAALTHQIPIVAYQNSVFPTGCSSPSPVILLPERTNRFPRVAFRILFLPQPSQRLARRLLENNEDNR